MTEVSTAESASTVEGIVEIKVWETTDLVRGHPGWENMTDEAKHALLRRPRDFPAAPTRVIRSDNMVLDAYLEALAAGENPIPTHLALGDGTTAPVETNTSLNNEVYRTFVGDTDVDGRDMLTSTFISQNEANGESIYEIGFTNGPIGESWTQLTHLVLDLGDRIDEKTSTMTVTIDYALLWRRVS